MIKRIALSLVTITMAVAAVTSATVAYFTQVESIGGNTITVGTFGFNLTNAGDQPLVNDVPFTLNNAKPGDTREIIFAVQKTGELPMMLRTYFDGSWTDSLEKTNVKMVKLQLLTGEPMSWGEEGTFTTLAENQTVGVPYDFPMAVSDNNIRYYKMTLQLDGEGTTTDYQGKTFTGSLFAITKQEAPTGVTIEWPTPTP